MANQQMIDSWQRGQAHYTQARHFTPGRQRTQYRTTEHGEHGQHGQAREMDLLVVAHNDVPAADIGLQRVDLIVNSGRYDRAAVHANGHLVNSYDKQAGITDHTALYSDQDMVRIRQDSGPPIRLLDRDGAGPPGAEIYSVWAKLKTNARGELVIDTAQPIHPGSGANRYSLHDVQEGMARAALREAGADPAHGQGLAFPPASPPYGGPVPATTPQIARGRAAAYTSEQLAAIREISGRPTPTTPTTQTTQTSPVFRASSQAGLAAASGPRRSVPSSPAPGQPGSRFNPNIRQQQPQAQASAVPDMVGAAAVPRNPQTQTAQAQMEQKAAKKAHRQEEAELDQTMSPARIEGDAIESRTRGVKAMHDVAASTARAQQSGSSNKGVVASAAVGTAKGASKGTAVGLARGLGTERASRDAQGTPQGSTEQRKRSSSTSSSGKYLVGRMGSVLSRGPEQNVTPQRNRPPVSERYDYQFEGKDQPSGIEQQHSA